MKLFDDNGYLDMGEIIGTGYPFIFIVGGRGIGKTYGALKYVYENDIFFMYMRRTQSQIDLVNKEQFNPFNAINADLGVYVRPKAFTKYNSQFEDVKTVGGEEVPEVIGYTAALSTIANMRSFDASRVSVLIYDEFIPEKHERPIKYEGVALLNAYESINRNRELKGRAPLQMVCCANAVDMANPIFLELDLVTRAMKMKEKRQQVYRDNKRGLLLINLDVTPIGQKKAKTALYNLSASGSEFSKMALENEYSFEEIGQVKPQSLKEYRPLVKVGEICIYEHKSDRKYYICDHLSGDPDIYTSGQADLMRYRKRYYYLWLAYLDNCIYFQNYLTQVLFERYTK